MKRCSGWENCYDPAHRILLSCSKAATGSLHISPALSCSEIPISRLHHHHFHKCLQVLGPSYIGNSKSCCLVWFTPFLHHHFYSSSIALALNLYPAGKIPVHAHLFKCTRNIRIHKKIIVYPLYPLKIGVCSPQELSSFPVFLSQVTKAFTVSHSSERREISGTTESFLSTNPSPHHTHSKKVSRSFPLYLRVSLYYQPVFGWL